MGNFSGLSLEQALTHIGISEVNFWRKIILLYLLEIVDFGEMAVDRELDRNVEEVIALYEQLSTGKIDYYELFGLKNTCSFNDIKNAYFAVAKKYHPDRISIAPDPEIKDKANFVFAEINKAYENLSNEDSRREYDTKGYKDNRQDDPVRGNMMEKARMLYRKARGFITRKSIGKPYPLWKRWSGWTIPRHLISCSWACAR